MPNMTSYEAEAFVPPTLLAQLERPPLDPRPVALMTCGLAGAGKTTLVKSVLKHLPHFTRISIDAIIFDSHGLYGVDYPASDFLYNQYNEEADAIYLETFKVLLAEGRDVVLERSFYAKEDRDEFRKLAEENGARLVFVFLRTHDKELLWERICKRSKGEKTADSALDISRETFDRYWTGFEEPDGEGEIVIEVFPSTR